MTEITYVHRFRGRTGASVHMDFAPHRFAGFTRVYMADVRHNTFQIRSTVQGPVRVAACVTTSKFKPTCQQGSTTLV